MKRESQEKWKETKRKKELKAKLVKFMVVINSGLLGHLLFILQINGREKKEIYCTLFAPTSKQNFNLYNFTAEPLQKWRFMVWMTWEIPERCFQLEMAFQVKKVPKLKFKLMFSLFRPPINVNFIWSKLTSCHWKYIFFLLRSYLEVE